MMASVYFLRNCDTDVVKENMVTVLERLKNIEELDDCKPVLLSSKRELISLSSVHGLPQYFVSLCRQHGLLKNVRATLLSPMDQLIAIQLCLAEKNKQDTGDFDVEVSVVLQASKDITNQKLLSNYDITSCTQESGICDLYTQFLEDCNAVDSCDVFDRIKEELQKNELLKRNISKQVFVILDMPKSLVEKKMLELLCECRCVKSVTMEVPMDSNDNVTLAIENSCIASILNADPASSTVKKPQSITEAYVRNVFLSYLELIVNSRSELALARVFNVPDRELTHIAFTMLKREAREKKMTMYQTASSLIMRIRLGGKGYAPDPNHPLGAYIKGIGELVTLIQRMETIIEEDPVIGSACNRTVNIIKKEMLKCKDSKVRKSSVESVSENLLQQISAIIEDLDKNTLNTPGKTVANGGSLVSHRARKVLRQLLDKLATVDGDMSTLDHLTDIYTSQHTPIRFPSIISQFRSPDEELEVASPGNRYSTTLSERVLNKMNKQTPVSSKRYMSNYEWATAVHSVGLQKDNNIFSSSQIYVIPSKTIVHAGSSFPSGQAIKLLESMLEQENMPGQGPSRDPNIRLTSTTNRNNEMHHKPVNSKDNSSGQEVKASKKRQPQDEIQSCQPAKKNKQDQSKSCRRRLLPQMKGQQKLTQFFRV